ncbi:uncharacterized protein [Branchiostoma lanceolatum]|uniref:uncharacterized protein n=1 Tax=Branchiostoma lanceolatum TaxID=7740 RepID=UPI003454ED2B
MALSFRPLLGVALVLLAMGAAVQAKHCKEDEDCGSSGCCVAGNRCSPQPSEGKHCKPDEIRRRTACPCGPGLKCVELPSALYKYSLGVCEKWEPPRPKPRPKGFCYTDEDCAPGECCPGRLRRCRAMPAEGKLCSDAGVRHGALCPCADGLRCVHQKYIPSYGNVFGYCSPKRSEPSYRKRLEGDCVTDEDCRPKGCCLLIGNTRNCKPLRLKDQVCSSTDALKGRECPCMEPMTCVGEKWHAATKTRYGGWCKDKT